MSSKSPGRGLPVELLDIIIANVSPHLPPLFGNTHRRRFDDLLHCRLVSRVFSSIASRWMWQRLEFRLLAYELRSNAARDGSAPANGTNLSQPHRADTINKGAPNVAGSDTSERHTEVSSWTTQQAAQFRDTCLAVTRRNDITSAVRDFSLVLDSRVIFASVDACSEALIGGSLEHTISTFESLKRVVIHFVQDAWFFSRMVQPIIHLLLWMPLIHTVVLTGVDCAVIASGPKRRALSNIKNLYLKSCKNSQHLLYLMPALEVFGLASNVALAQELPLPWETIRELTLETIPYRQNLRLIAENFQEWKKTLSNRKSSRLLELVVRGDDNLFTDEVTTAFCGQSLRKLSIGKVRNMTIASLESIVDAFPELEELSVFAAKWHGSKTRFTRTVSRLANLSILNWNFFAGRERPEFYRAAILCLGEEASRPLIRASKKVSCIPIAACLSDFCSQFLQLTFYDDDQSCESDALQFEIVPRDREGQVGPGPGLDKVRYRGLGPRWQYVSSYWTVEQDIRDAPQMLP